VSADFSGNAVLIQPSARVETLDDSAPTLTIGGVVPLSTVDFPDRLAAVVFCQGCPWRCEYCHNPHLLPADGPAALMWRDIVALLQRRRGFLDAVVFTGGEPLRQPGLEQAIAEVKAMGFQVAVHTAGCYPDRLERLLPSLDWVAMDIKAPFDRYQTVTTIPHSGEKARASINHVIASGVAGEFHTTVGAAMQQPGWLYELALSLAEIGVRNYILQECRTAPGIACRISPVLVDQIRPLFATLTIRRAA
jgi:pyruvate formate lyase activating enzyme